MNLSIFDTRTQADQTVLVIDEASLYRAFEQVKDGRKKKGKRYPLALLLTLILLGKLAGEHSINGIVDWVKERKSWLQQVLNWPRPFPVNATYSFALAHCDGHEVAQAIAQVVLKAKAVAACENEPSRLVAHAHEEEPLIHTAMDGKVLRGTLGHERATQPPVHLLSLYECESGLVIAQEAVRSKQNEITAAGAFLHPLLLKGRIISADAMHTQKKWCAGVHLYHGYYLLTAKDNQATVRQDILDFFADPALDQGEWQTAKTVQKGHGRLDVREIWTSTGMNEWFEREWTGIAQIFKIRRWVKEKDKEREEIVYGFTNLPRSKASAKRLLELNQRHWSIENRLHYRRDVTLGEDASQIRVKGAPQTVAALNGGVLALMDWLGVSNVASQMRHFDAHPRKALHLLLGRLSPQDG
ncbi:MAG TPA: ISAs1 family transposase [Ktedonobacter sp.]|jgi:predicted transposase YbfD/YdcC|nr:ISAs1 family transposase [Ktedonobacter sp.]